MEVCEVCGAFLIVGDAQSRVDDHLMGKQHMGYAKIKSTVEELKVTGLHVSGNKTHDLMRQQLFGPCYGWTRSRSLTMKPCQYVTRVVAMHPLVTILYNFCPLLWEGE